MKSENRKPILTEGVDLAYTKGLYAFFSGTVARLAAVALAILASAGQFVTGSAAVVLVSCLWIVNHNARKLEGISSISSSVNDNVLCAAWRKVKNCICAHCYAYNQQSFQTGLREHNVLNGIILRNVLLPVCAFKHLRFLYPYLRIESFGDVANITQARNYIRIIKAFPRIRCAIWSKNIELWAQAFDLERGKPKNTTFVISSPIVNKPVSESIIRKYTFIDHVFTVYTRQFAKQHNITINCGGRKCLECIMKKTNCYYAGGPLYINELKK